MKALRHCLLRFIAVILAVSPSPAVCSQASGETLSRKVLVDGGWHPWYEIKQDPESREKLIICGTKWDALHNSPFGFVAASSDGGASWRVVLEDRSSAWVTEQSCAFGADHRGYFLSGASIVADGKLHHERGTTRLYVSTDSAEHWIETIETGWTDYSTSAFSSATGRLYTFFNAIGSEHGPNEGGRVGLVLFSSDGKIVTGPFFDSAAGSREFGSLYPSDAVALKDGTIAALYFGAQPTAGGLEVELGIVRTDASAEPLLARTAIAHAVLGSACVNFEDGALAYDAERDVLYVVYLDGCTDTRLMLTTSKDGGRTWAKSLSIRDPDWSDREMAYPSLVVGRNGMLTLLWEEGRQSGQWRLANIEEGSILGPVAELSRSAKPAKIRNDGLRFWTSQSRQGKSGGPDEGVTSSITVHVEDDSMAVWRGRGLVGMANGIIALWPSHDENGTHLCSVLVGAIGSEPDYSSSVDARDSLKTDVTDWAVLLYGGEQEYDKRTGILRVCMMLGNRGDSPIKVPIQLQDLGVRSPSRNLSILEAGKPVIASQTVWDISGSVPDGYIAPGSNSDPFCLSFRLELDASKSSLPGELDLFTLKLRVLAAGETGSR